MAWSPSIYLLPTFLGGVISIAVAMLAWSHRSERTARPFIAFLLGLALWSIAYGIELGYRSAAMIILWDKIAFIGSVVVPVALLLVAIEYAGLEDRLPAWGTPLLAVEPIITLALAWSYPRTRLVWTSFDVVQAGGIVLPSPDFGPWYWVNFGYSYLLIAVALVLIGSVYFRGRRIYRRQSELLVAGI
ncbi:MAG: histidine kinase N-terminal 7TM domain-containing protein, partial [Halobacteriaceae archaeon]